MPQLTAGTLLVITTFFAPEWDRDLITSGAYKYARQFSPDNFDWRAGHLEYYREGAAGTVSVRRLAGSRSLAIDGKVDASNGADMLTQRLLGLLPTLLHLEPRAALVIGLGSGVTADAVLASGEVRHVDVLEISPEVAEASAYFTRENHDVLKRPGVRLIVGDGRSHLRLSSQEYDVIISEPSNPWMAGVAALFTREFFEAARARLSSGGVFCQWSHTYEISEQDLRSIVRTFSSVFPDGTMWLVGEGDLLLIGSDAADLSQGMATIAQRVQEAVPAMLADVGVPQGAAPFVLLSLYAGGPRELARLGSGARIQTDDRMPLEFTAARAMYAPPPGNAARLRAIAASAALPAGAATIVQNARAEDWIARGDATLRAEAFAVAHESFRRAAAIDSQSARALRGSGDAAASLQQMVEETDWLKTVAAADPGNVAVRVELSHAMATLGDPEAGIAAALDAVRIDSRRPEPLEQLASILADVGDVARLTPVADELVTRFPMRQEGRYYRAAARFLAGRSADAERELRILLGADPRHAKGHNLLGAVCAAMRNHDCARAAFINAQKLDPRDASVYVNLGYLSLDTGDPTAAVEYFREALVIDPTSEAAKKGIAEQR
jgi:spermidine synthase